MVQTWLRVPSKSPESDFLQNAGTDSTRAPICLPCTLLGVRLFGLELSVENLRQASPELLQDPLLRQALRALLLLGLLALGQQTGARGLHHVPGDAQGRRPAGIEQVRSWARRFVSAFHVQGTCSSWCF